MRQVRHSLVLAEERHPGECRFCSYIFANATSEPAHSHITASNISCGVRCHPSASGVPATTYLQVMAHTDCDRTSNYVASQQLLHKTCPSRSRTGLATRRSPVPLTLDSQCFVACIPISEGVSQDRTTKWPSCYCKSYGFECR